MLAIGHSQIQVRNRHRWSAHFRPAIGFGAVLVSLLRRNRRLQKAAAHRKAGETSGKRQMAPLQKREGATTGSHKQHIGLVLGCGAITFGFQQPTTGRRAVSALYMHAVFDGYAQLIRSEERRVGKECRSRLSTGDYKK